MILIQAQPTQNIFFQWGPDPTNPSSNTNVLSYCATDDQMWGNCAYQGIVSPGKSTSLSIKPGGMVTTANTVPSMNSYQIAYPNIWCYGTVDYLQHNDTNGQSTDATLVSQQGCSSCIPSIALPPLPSRPSALPPGRPTGGPLFPNYPGMPLWLATIGVLASKACTISSCFTLSKQCGGQPSGQSLVMGLMPLTVSVGNVYGNIPNQGNYQNVQFFPWTYVTITPSYSSQMGGRPNNPNPFASAVNPNPNQNGYINLNQYSYPNMNMNVNPNANPNPNMNMNSNPNMNPNPNPNMNMNSNPNMNTNPNPNMNMNINPNPNPNVNINSNPNPNMNMNPNPNPNLNSNSFFG